MAGVVANEPYQRVSQDNSPFNGAFIGMATGGLGAGAGIFGTRMHYNGISNRAKRDLEVLEKQQPFFEKYRNDVEDRYVRDMARIDRGGLLNQGTFRRAERAEEMLREAENRQIDQNHLRELRRDIERRQEVMDRRRERAERRYDRAMDRIEEYEKALRQHRDPNFIESRQQLHPYSKYMGGRRNAAIIGASAIIGGGLGMITDGINDM